LKPNIILFDIDGVLIAPMGYRLAMEETCRYFLDQAGVGSLAPDGEIYSLFESQRVTSEWDMVPLALLIVLDQISQFTPLPEIMEELDGALAWVKANPPAIRQVEYREEILKFGSYIRTGVTAAQAILEAKINGQGENLFVRLGHPKLLWSLLGDSRNIQNQIIRKFQEFALGGETYRKLYGEAPPYERESNLLAYDRSMILPEVRETLEKLIHQQSLYAALYTARPSLFPREIRLDSLGYSPEAEMAGETCGMESFPLIGYGKLGYLAAKMGRTIPEFIKPAPLQAMAALAAAWTRNEWLSLKWAYDVLENGSSEMEMPLPKEFKLTIVEDSAAGIVGGRRAAEVLNQGGWQVGFHPVGISTHPEKIRALQAVGAEIFPDVNVALEKVFSGMAA